MHVSRNTQEKCVKASVMRQRKLYLKYFTLKEFGNWERAEAEAKRWINSFIKTLPPEIPREGRMTRKNRSGVVGVYRSKGIVRKPNGKIYSCPRWVARWPKCPLSGGLSWSVIQFDEVGAFALAVIGRRQKSVNREEVLSYLESILHAPEMDEICALKQM